ncbi:formylglycine-generating enzyme family protein [Aquimarina pacifica]|uniref:formylglycine-generating enzyme family protein n=1 Tax=Aquimarina pacifica TaxID=1296415 RepID=UPI001F4C7683|nr:formylglycine-generating enzyme family protein [Aquimarina pacifica]
MKYSLEKKCSEIQHQTRSFCMFVLFIIGSMVCACKNDKSETSVTKEKENTIRIKSKDSIPSGMVWIPEGTFFQGAKKSDTLAMAHEMPRHSVHIDSFLIDIHEVTNAQFDKFVQETKYITLAERPVDWEELRKQLPPGTPKPADSILQPGSLIFKDRPDGVANLYNFSQWWEWKNGANWKHPQGPESDILGKENYPVVHVAYEDALAYCKWAGRELPTEAQWEYAATGGEKNKVFFWGNQLEAVAAMANTYTGDFPKNDDKSDGYSNTAPVKTYPANNFGLYDTAGNVWEWTSDWYDPNYYSQIHEQVLSNPSGPNQPINGRPEKVIKGGSFLCNDTYCASFRISARMGNSLDSSSEHKGFRTIINK